MIPNELQTVFESLNVPFAAVACEDTGEIQFFGEQKVLGNSDLVSTLFGDLDKVAALNRSLVGQVLPRIWNQGNVNGVVCKPTNTVIVGLFMVDERDVIEQYQWSKKADETIKSAFSKFD